MGHTYPHCYCGGDQCGGGGYQFDSVHIHRFQFLGYFRIRENHQIHGLGRGGGGKNNQSRIKEPPAGPVTNLKELSCFMCMRFDARKWCNIVRILFHKIFALAWHKNVILHVVIIPSSIPF
jgi:hypothetical protein